MTDTKHDDGGPTYKLTQAQICLILCIVGLITIFDGCLASPFSDAGARLGTAMLTCGACGIGAMICNRKFAEKRRREASKP